MFFMQETAVLIHCAVSAADLLKGHPADSPLFR
jgi:hypothetical protein